MTRSVFNHRRGAGSGVLLSADSFNRANNASMGSTDGVGLADPATWVNQVGSCGITSNAARVNTGSARCTVDLGTADVDISLLCVTPVNANEGIVFRWVDNSNYWGFVQSGGHVLLFKFQAGSNTGQTMIANPVLLGGDTMRVIAGGSNIACYLNSTLCASITDSFNNTATKHGIYQNTNVHSVWDDWRVLTP